MLTISAHRRLGALVAAVAVLVPGCLERKETIQIDRDGSVRMRVELTGDPGDFASGDALPDRRSGWKTEDEFETKDNGDQEQRRIATREFGAGAPLPDAYVDPDDPQYGIALMFPTTLEIERRPDGRYYHFKRVYEARAQARYQIHRELLEDAFAKFGELADKNPAELTDQERKDLVNLLRTLEILKQAEYVAAGAAALEDTWPQHYGLLLRQALFEYFHSIDVSLLVDLLAQPDTPERNAAIDEFGEGMVAGTRDVLLGKLRELRVPRDEIELFLAAHDEEGARRAVTEDLPDEHWRVRVEMPGEIVAHNGDDADEHGVVWEFPGKVMHDRDHVLMVTSRVTADGRRAWQPD